jgi:hypothetical protein
VRCALAEGFLILMQSKCDTTFSCALPRLRLRIEDSIDMQPDSLGFLVYCRLPASTRKNMPIIIVSSCLGLMYQAVCLSYHHVLKISWLSYQTW